MTRPYIVRKDSLSWLTHAHNAQDAKRQVIAELHRASHDEPITLKVRDLYARRASERDLESFAQSVRDARAQRVVRANYTRIGDKRERRVVQ